jgi:hypothetical protein
MLPFCIAFECWTNQPVFPIWYEQYDGENLNSIFFFITANNNVANLQSFEVRVTLASLNTGPEITHSTGPLENVQLLC